MHVRTPMPPPPLGVSPGGRLGVSPGGGGKIKNLRKKFKKIKIVKYLGQKIEN